MGRGRAGGGGGEKPGGIPLPFMDDIIPSSDSVWVKLSYDLW